MWPHVIFSIVLLSQLVSAQVHAVFSFNSQVPDVARVSQPYSFQIAGNTFSSPQNLSYSLINAPLWLSIDTVSRIFYGTPRLADVGSATFVLRASDATSDADMQCTLVIVDSPAPQLAGDLSVILGAQGTLVDPDTLTIQPGAQLAVNFPRTTFAAGGAPIDTYYAILTDRTPLPAWLSFDANSLTFSGIAPMPNPESQIYFIDLIAADVLGFAGATVSFNILVAQHKFAFSPRQEQINVTAGEHVTISTLATQLRLDGASIQLAQATVSSFSAPDWLKLDHASLVLSGTPPHTFSTAYVNISVQNQYGDIATKSLVLQNLYAPQAMGTSTVLNATVGKLFSERLQSIVPDVGTDVNVTIMPSTSWLQYNSTLERLVGNPSPSDIDHSCQVVLSWITADGQRVRHNLTIDALPANAIGHAVSGPAANILELPNEKNHLSRAAIAGLVTALIVFALLILLLCVCVARRRKRRQATLPLISRPVAVNNDGISSPELLKVPSIKYAGERAGAVPAIPPRSPLRSRPLQTEPTVSSIGAGEEALRHDINIPWSDGLPHQQSRKHEDYFGQSSRPPMTRKGTATSWRRLLRKWSNRDARLGAVLTQHAGSAVHVPGRRPTFAIDTSQAGETGTLSMFESQRTSRISHRPHSDGGSTLFGLSQVSEHEQIAWPLPLAKMENKQSNRLVPRSSSAVTQDRRSFTERRQSWIRQRARSGTPSVLFTTESRAVGSRSQSNESTHLAGQQYAASNKSTTINQSTMKYIGHGRVITARQSLAVPFSPTSLHDSRSSMYTTTASSATEDADTPADTAPEIAILRKQLALPRHERNWVLPGEASPTPPPLSHSKSIKTSSANEVISPSSRERHVTRHRIAKRLQRNSRGSLLMTTQQEIKEENVYEMTSVKVDAQTNSNTEAIKTTATRALPMKRPPSRHEPREGGLFSQRLDVQRRSDRPASWRSSASIKTKDPKNKNFKINDLEIEELKTGTTANMRTVADKENITPVELDGRGVEIVGDNVTKGEMTKSSSALTVVRRSASGKGGMLASTSSNSVKMFI